jgi:hypothetical protein
VVEKIAELFYNLTMNDNNENAAEIKFVDPKNDVAFRKIFGDENKKEILISFLNNVLEFAGTDKEIIDITIKNPYQVPKLKELKETILDIKAVDKRNIHYIIEMQVFHTTAFEVANQMSWSKEELDAYDARGIYIQDERGRLEAAQDEGKKIGLDEGKKIGLDEGKKIGLDEGKKIGRKGRETEIAGDLKRKGVSIDIIAASTGLTKEEIEKL